MCAKRKYKFSKRRKGVVPTVIQNLLDARAYTRKQKKVLGKIVKGKEITDEETELVKTLIPKILKNCDEKEYKLSPDELTTLGRLDNVLEKRQLSYKVAANSMYGIMGVSKGALLPFMPGAMATTAMGRENIEKVAKVIVDKYRGKLLYGDSVAEDTPILCKINHKICYRTIDNLPLENWVEYKNDKEEAKTNNIEVWTDKGFTQIKKIIRHKTTKEMFRVLTHTGVVDVTEDHGLLDKDANKISPKNIKIGSELLTRDLPQLKLFSSCFDGDEAFVMGMFYVDGSCEHTWAINNKDRELLQKCQKILNSNYTNIQFKILEPMKSSNVLKLIPVGKGIKDFVILWRSLFYDKRKYKKVPDDILVSVDKTRQLFLDGYYCGDCDKDKGKIGSAGLYYLASSLGYKVSINIIKDIYRITCTKGKQRKKENKVTKIVSLGKTERYVYDLETENHHFSAGIGKLIVHNTDSSYVMFPHIKTIPELWDYCLFVAAEVTKMFPPPIQLEFEEEIYKRFFILTKKRYMYLKCYRDGIVDTEIGKKGVLLARRDNSAFVRNIYSEVNMMIFNKKHRDDIVYYVITELNKLCSSSYSYKDFIITKSIGDDGKLQVIPGDVEKGVPKGKCGSYKVKLLSDDIEKREQQYKLKNCKDPKTYYLRCLPAQVQLAHKMRLRGQRVDAGTRLEYVITNQAPHKAKQYEKLESSEYFGTHQSVLRLDYLSYLKLLVNPMDEALNIVFKDKSKYKYIVKTDLVLNQYKYRLKVKGRMLEELKSLFEPCIMFQL